jgi:hypothetical protein
MKTISKVEQEVNQIRLEIYEETKNMTPAQRVEYFNKTAEAEAKKYGFKIVASAKENNTRPL